MISALQEFTVYSLAGVVGKSQTKKHINKIFACCNVQLAELEKRMSALISDKRIREGLSEEVNLSRGGGKEGQREETPKQVEKFRPNP